jgi:hypothetical protein
MFSENDIANFVKVVSDTPDGLDFIYYLIEEFGTFTTKINLNASELQNICNSIKREQGEFILNLLREHNFKKYIEVQQRRSNEKCQKTLN